MRSLLITSEAVTRARAACARRAAARTPASTSRARARSGCKYNVIIKKGADGAMEVEKRRSGPSRRRSSSRSRNAKIEDLESGKVGAGSDVMATRARSRSGAATQDGGEFKTFEVEVDAGMVVLDVLHRIQAQQANDLALRWNCKAGKCGSCSMEINGKPKLVVHDAHEHASPTDETITVQPLKTFPVIKDLVTDVSWNYAQNKRIPPFKPRPRERRRHAPDVPGRRRPRAGVPQVHRVLPVPGRLPRAARSRRHASRQLRRPALHDPARERSRCTRSTPTTASPRSATSSARACATSRAAAPRSAPSTSTSPTTASSR